MDPITTTHPRLFPPAAAQYAAMTPAERDAFFAPRRRRDARRPCGDWDPRAEALEQRSFDDDAAYTSSTREDGPAHRAPADWPLLQLDEDDLPTGEAGDLDALRSTIAEQHHDAERDAAVAS
jgi:hypothetical protein